jgi:general secretion pathway protein D
MMSEFLNFHVDRVSMLLRALTTVLCTSVLLGLAGCAGSQAFREGNHLFAQGKSDEAITKFEEAVKLDPKNAEYRITLTTRRTSVVNRALASAEAARREGRLTEAEKGYRQTLGYDSNSVMAKQGLEALIVERQHRLIMMEAELLFKKADKTSLSTATEKLRGVLSQNPLQKEALNLKARMDEQRAKEIKPEAQLAAAYRKPITLEFRDAPLRSVFDVISKVSGLNFFFDKDMRPDLKATVLAKNTTIEDAVRLLLVTNQLEQKVLNENSILVYPNTPQKLKDYQTLAVRTFYLTNADVKSVSNTIKTIVKTKDLVIDERLGLIIMRDTPEAVRLAERIIALQDLSDPEVMLEVEVVEIKRSRLLELGIQWPGQLALSPLQGGGVPLVLDDLRRLNSTNIQATLANTLINARKEEQDGNILANPRIRVRNKEKAKILIGDRVPVITTTSNATGFVAESVNYVDVGLKLEVEPNIYLDDEVAIKINLEVSSLVREVLSKSGSLSYQIGTRNATTVLRLKDGETQILAGLISDEDRSSANKVPGLGEIPIAGRLFGSQKDDTQRSEILLSITPRIVRAIRRPDLLEAEFESGTESGIGAQSLRLTTVASQPASVTGSTVTTATTAPLPTDVPAATAPLSSAPVGADTPAVALPPAVNKAAVVPATGVLPAGSLNLSWQLPAQVKAGEQFTASLRVNSQAALRGLPLLVGFDPQVLQVVSVQEGDYFKQGGGQTTFNQRVDPAQGKVFVAAIRQNTAGNDAGINGNGVVVNVVFKALKASPGAKVQLLSVSPEPAPASPLAMPLEQLLRIVP